MANMKFYNQLTVKQRKQLREQFERIVINKKKQIELFEKNLVEPLKHQIQLTKLVQQNKMSLEQFVAVNEKWSAWLQKVMKLFNEK